MFVNRLKAPPRNRIHGARWYGRCCSKYHPVLQIVSPSLAGCVSEISKCLPQKYESIQLKLRSYERCYLATHVANTICTGDISSPTTRRLRRMVIFRRCSLVEAVHKQPVLRIFLYFEFRLFLDVCSWATCEIGRYCLLDLFRLHQSPVSFCCIHWITVEC